jgi:hypothetical protein
MDCGKVLGLDFATSVAVFGPGPSSFLSRLNADHPDLGSEPFASFFADAEQTARCAAFCVDKSLRFPLFALSSAFPRSHPSFFSAVRLLDRRGREDARSRKSAVRPDFDSLASDPLASSPDLPSSFERFKGEADGRSRWEAMESDFRSVGCSSMAAAAALIASEFSIGDLGLRSLSIRRAFLILGRGLGAWDSGRRLFPVAVPACSVSLPGWASASIEASESAMMGHPLFDHHVVLSFSETPDPPISLSEDIVILGERDGRFHFLDSD